MSHHIVEIKNLGFTYPDGTQALKGINLKIIHGESVALVGANGAGKSTLLLHLNGYLSQTEGNIRIGDFPITRQNLKEVRRSVGMLFQDPDDQLFMSKVYDDVAFGLLNMGLPIEEVDIRVKQALETVEVGHLKDRPPYKLSGGQKRRVAIASVLSMSPDILVMDEPSAGLDPRSRRQLIELLRTFRHTKIIATHDLDMVLNLCERTVILHNGSIKADGPTREIFMEKKLLEETGLEKPLQMQGCPVCGSSGITQTNVS